MFYVPNTRAKVLIFNSNYGESIIISIFQTRKLRLRVLSNLLKAAELTWPLSDQDLNQGLSKFTAQGHDQEGNLCY